jgi:indole-3-glycerol phosphate synthase
MTGTAQPENILERIARAKRAELETLRAAVPQSELEKKVAPRASGVFRKALLERHPGQPDCAVIAEAKKASPSRGLLCPDYDAARIARSYERARARAVSVLTDREFFQGSLDDLRHAKAVVSLPVLRKDFTLDEYHVYEAAAAGADAVLLIAALLSPPEISQLLRVSERLGLDALVEVHTAPELRAALQAGARLIGVNNRNLKTFEVSLQTSIELIESIPDDCVAVSESGLRSGADLARLQAAGFDAFLIGELFMTQPDPGAALRQLLDAVPARSPVSN